MSDVCRHGEIGSTCYLCKVLEIERLSEDLAQSVLLLRDARKFAEQAGRAAELKHDNYGDYYMDHAQREIMEETQALVGNIDLVLTKAGVPFDQC